MPVVHHHFGIKPEPLTAKAICDGVVAGMLADHFLGCSEATFESAIRPYLLAVAHKRGFGASFWKSKLLGETLTKRLMWCSSMASKP